MRTPQQLALGLTRSHADDSGVTRLPFAISIIRVRRAAKRRLRAAAASLDPASLLPAAAVLLDQALLDQVRERARIAACAGGRPSKCAAFAFACKPEGRRVARVIAVLSERIAAQEAKL